MYSSDELECIAMYRELEDILKPAFVAYLQRLLDEQQEEVEDNDLQAERDS